jgi:hypothetical protein
MKMAAAQRAALIGRYPFPFPFPFPFDAPTAGPPVEAAVRMKMAAAARMKMAAQQKAAILKRLSQK